MNSVFHTSHWKNSDGRYEHPPKHTKITSDDRPNCRDMDGRAENECGNIEAADSVITRLGIPGQGTE